MPSLIVAALVVVGSGLAALLTWPLLAAGARVRNLGFAVICGAIAAAPLLISPQARLARFLAALAATMLLVKLADLALGPRLAPLPGLGHYAVWLTNIYSLVFRQQDDEPHFSVGRELLRLGVGIFLAAVGAAAMAALWRLAWPSFAAEHVAKATLVLATLWPASAAGAALTRLSGQPARGLMVAPVLARTPAEFWRRYNRPVNQWLQVHVFLPMGGRRSPGRGILAAFFVSGLIHEYVFAIPLGAVCGYQLAFFLVQGVAVAATARLRPRGPAAALGSMATWAFMLASSTLFFASLQGVLPFYVSPMPKWLNCGR